MSADRPSQGLRRLQPVADWLPRYDRTWLRGDLVAGENPGDETFQGIAALRLDSGLFFATAEALDDRVRAVIRDSEPRLHALVIDLEGVDFVDSQGAAKLAELYEVAKTDGVTLRLARVKPQVLAVLDADGMVATLGADGIHGNVDQAIEAQLAEDARLGAQTGA